MKSTRIKPQPIQTLGEFISTIDELATLEATRRKIDAERDLACQAVNAKFDERAEPIDQLIKGKFALASAYAEAHRGELLPKGSKSAITSAGARYGWQLGKRAVALVSKATEEHAINALKALGLERYVRQKEEIAKDLILADCADGKTLQAVGDSVVSDRQVPISGAGLKITQAERFFVEPPSQNAETLTPATAA